MREHLRRPAAAIAVLAAAAVLVTSGAAAPPGAAARSAPGALPGPAVAGAPARSILLVNGDNLVVGHAGAGASQALGIVPEGGGHRPGAMLALGLGRTLFEIPQVALPYLGRGLAPGLFRVSSLERAETGGRLPVTVAYRGKVPSLPGVTITHAGGGTAMGYLTAAGAQVFGAALARQFASDHARGSYGQDGMFAGGVSIGLAGLPAPAPAPGPAPAFPMHTLTVTGTNLAGKPDTGDLVFVFNADNARRFDDPVESVNVFDKGVAKFSVPAGHYWAFGLFPTDLKNNEIEYHVPVLPQFTVFGDTTVHIDERAADSQVQMITPRPAVPDNQTFELRHPTPAGPAVSFWWFAGYAPLFFSPTTRRPTAGTLQAYVFEQLASPATAAGTPYEYNLAYAATGGLIPRQRYVVKPASLATVHARYYSDVATTGEEVRFGVFPAQWQTIPGWLILPLRVPRQQTEYMTGNPAIRWVDKYTQNFQNGAGGQNDDLRVFHAGQRLAENWNAYPLHEGYNTNLTGAANLKPAIPSASRAGNTLTLDVMPFSDSTPGHVSASGFGRAFGPFGKITGHYVIDQNGTAIASGNPLNGFGEIGPSGEFHTRVTLSPHPATLRFALDASRTGTIYTLSTATQTVWAWRTAPHSSARLPAGWACALTARGTPAGGRDCAVQPMMTLGYHVAGMALTGVTPAGPQMLHLSVGHLQLATTTTITHASLSVSFDGGKTWHAARITGHHGSYTAAYTAPTAVKVSLRTSAADAAGGSITETITNAYQTTS